MWKKVLTAGLAGGVIFILWAFIVNGVLGLYSSIHMKKLPDERKIYEILKNEHLKPGKYLCNPEIIQEKGFPFDEPVFAVHYSGLTHGDAGMLMIVSLVVAFLAALLAGFLLTRMSEEILVQYWRKVLFFVLIGVLIAIYSDMKDFGIDRFPLKDAVMMAANTVFSWTAAGIVMALIIKPD